MENGYRRRDRIPLQSGHVMLLYMAGLLPNFLSVDGGSSLCYTNMIIRIRLKCLGFSLMNLFQSLKYAKYVGARNELT